MHPLWLLLLPLPLALTIDASLSDINLQRRPLNAYVTANAVHVKPANRSLTVEGTTIPYTEAFPPFLIHNRGTVLVLTPNPNLLFAGRPSLFQMITATGHRTIAPYLIPPNIGAFIQQAEMHHNILISFSPIDLSFRSSQLEGAILIDPSEDSDLPAVTLPTVLLYTDSKTADQGAGDDWKNTRIESTTFPVSSLSTSAKSREKFGQILANFFDHVHRR